MKTSEKRSKRNKRCRLFTAFTFIFVLFFYVSTAYAHKVYLFAWAEGGMIHTESYFPGNIKVKDGTIKVFDMQGKELVSGKTDENGDFSFKIPEIADLRIVMDASMGHGAEYLFKKSEFTSDQVPAAEVASDDNSGDKQENPVPVTIGQDHLRKELDAALDAKLKPVIKELALLREDKGPGVTEVVGGIGYIFGLMGVIAYMKSKNDRVDGEGHKAQG